MYILQNFYKQTVSVKWNSVGAGNFYVSTKPTPSTGILVLNPSSTTKREIVKYSAVGTDATGDYVTIAQASDRGLGGTTAQTHEVGEAVRMNITAEHWADLADAVDQVQDNLNTAILLGASPASTTLMGIGRLSTSPDTTLGTATITIASPAVVSYTAHGLTAGDIVKFTTTGTLPTGLVASTPYYVISAGLTADAFRLSASYNGSAINTSGTQSGTHTLVKSTPVALSPNDTRVSPVSLASLTTGRVAALAGNNSDVAVGSGNLFVTQTGLQHNAEKWVADGSGSSTAYTAVLSPAPTSVTDGMVVYVKIGLANTTTTPTLAVNGLTARTIVKLAGTALAVGDIAAGMYCTFQYDLTNTRWIMLTPSSNPIPPISQLTTPVRALGSTYQNTGSKNIFVMVSVEVTRGGTGTNGNFGRATAYMDTASTPVTVVGYVQSMQAATAANNEDYQKQIIMLTFVVPPGSYYKVVSTGTGGSATLGTWTEQEL